MSWPAELHLRRADGAERRVLDQRLRALHRVAVVDVRLVPLDLRELGRVLVRDALVAEVLRQLVHLLEAADDQPLEVQLVGDAQVQVGVELVRVRDERLREAAAVARLEDRRLDLEKALAVEVRAHLGDDARPRRGEAPRVLVHQQVEVAPPVPLLDVGHAVERVGQAARGSSRAARASGRRATARRGGTSSARPRRRRCRRGRGCTSPTSSGRTSSCIRPLRSTRSRNISLPMSRRAMTRPASRRAVGPSASGSSASASARTAAISSRFGKRFGSGIARV